MWSAEDARVKVDVLIHFVNLTAVDGLVWSDHGRRILARYKPNAAAGRNAKWTSNDPERKGRKDVYLSNRNNMSSPPQVRPQQVRAEVDERRRTETVLVKQPGGLILQFCPHPAIRSLAMTSSSIFIAWYGDVSIQGKMKEAKIGRHNRHSCMIWRNTGMQKQI